MAERSKAPDSRFTPSFAQPSAKDRAFWSTNVGAGSNPASDNLLSLMLPAILSCSNAILPHV